MSQFLQRVVKTNYRKLNSIKRDIEKGIFYYDIVKYKGNQFIVSYYDMEGKILICKCGDLYLNINTDNRYNINTKVTGIYIENGNNEIIEEL